MGDTFPIECFASGTYKDTLGRDIEFTDTDLDQIVTNFNSLNGLVKPPLKLGHSDTQIFAQSDGQPALGWVTDLKRNGNKLMAYAADVPQVVKDAISAGRFRRCSSEFHLNFANSSYEKNNKTGVEGKVLEAIALLGADLPQVASLADLTTYLSSPVAADGERLVASVPITEDASAATTKDVSSGAETVEKVKAAKMDAEDAADKGSDESSENESPTDDGSVSSKSKFHPIQKTKGGYVLHGRHGQVLGHHPDHASAVKQLRAVEYFMHHSKHEDPESLFATLFDATREVSPEKDLIPDSSPAESNTIEEPTGDGVTMADDKQSDEQLKAAQEQYKVELATRDAKVAQLEERLLAAEKVQAENAHKVAQHNAVEFASNQADANRIAPAQIPWLAAMHLAMTSGKELGPDDQERVALSVKDRGEPKTALDALKGFLATAPSLSPILRASSVDENHRDVPRKGLDFNTLLAAIAEEHKLNLKNSDERLKATVILGETHPEMTGTRFAVRE